MRADLDHLHALYATTDDPWRFRSSPYEAMKYGATLDALPRAAFAHALEIGCGNGELGRRIAPRCAAYTGLDAVDVALEAARRAVPEGRFVQAFLPCELPEGDYDLVVLSEILYFLDPDGIDALVEQIDRRWAGADLLTVTWCGPSGHLLSGEEACSLFAAATPRRHEAVERVSPDFRIDRFAPLNGPRE